MAVTDIAVCLLLSPDHLLECRRQISIRKTAILIFTIPLEREGSFFEALWLSAVSQKSLRPAQEVVYVYCSCYPHPLPHVICYSKCTYNPRIIRSSFLALLASFCNCFAFQGKEYPELMTTGEASDWISRKYLHHTSQPQGNYIHFRLLLAQKRASSSFTVVTLGLLWKNVSVRILGFQP